MEIQLDTRVTGVMITRRTRQYREGDVLNLPMHEARKLLRQGYARKLSTMEMRKHGLLIEEKSGHHSLETRGEGSRHFEKTTRMIPIKIVRNNGKAGAFEAGTISEMPFHEAMKLVEDGWAEHLTKAERDEHGFI